MYSWGTKRTIITALLFVIFAEGLIIIVPWFGSIISKDKRLDSLASFILFQCKDAPHKPSCYDKEIPKLTDTISMEDTFNVTRKIQEQDQSYWYCHVLAHNLATREVSKNKHNWKETFLSCPLGMCSNGCVHGVLMERFQEEHFSREEVQAITPELALLCEPRDGWHPNDLERSTCYHALGHLTMYITNADIEEAANMCDKIAVKEGENFSQSCYDGAFMQIFQPLEPEDFALVEGKVPSKDEMVSFCKRFEGEKRVSCWSESWPLFFHTITDPAASVAFCKTLREERVEFRCFNAVFFIMTAHVNLDPVKIAEFCGGIPLNLRGRCLGISASRFFETDTRLIAQASSLCFLFNNFKTQEDCVNEVLWAGKVMLHEKLGEYETLCSSFPLAWQTRCFSNLFKT